MSRPFFAHYATKQTQSEEASMINKPSPYDAVISDLEIKRDQIIATIEALKLFKSGSVGAGGSFPVTAVPARSGPEDSRTISHDTFFGMTIGDAAKKYLNMVKATKPTGEIGQALELGGLKHASKDFNTTVRSVLGSRDDFLRVNGDWGLTDWYPNMKNREKRASRNGHKAAPAPIPAPAPEEKPAEAPKRAPARYVPTGNTVPIIAFLGGHPGEVYSAKEIATGINRIETLESVASLLSVLAKKGRIARSKDGGYTTNEETMRLFATK